MNSDKILTIIKEKNKKEIIHMLETIGKIKTLSFFAELQNRPPRDISTWYVDYFMLKAMETLRFKRNHCPPFNYLEEFVFLFFFPKQNYYQREILFK